MCIIKLESSGSKEGGLKGLEFKGSRLFPRGREEGVGGGA